jgi:hypothetical protein
MSNEHIARAIVYAVRQAQLINQYGMTWEAIEVNTANILAGCSVPADGKMNSAEAVQATIMERLRTQADTPPNRNMIGSHPLPWTLRTVTIPSFRAHGTPRAIRHELIDDNGRIVGNIRHELAARKMVDWVNGTKDEHAQGIISRQIASLQRIKGERDEAHAERDKALEAMRIEATAAQEARKEALANRLGRDQFAAKWATLKGECHAQNQRANQAEKDNAELRRQLDTETERGDRLQQDRDGLRKGAQYWYDETTKAREELHAQASARNTADDIVVKLRTFLERKWCNVCSCDTEAIATILEETK